MMMGFQTNVQSPLEAKALPQGVKDGLLCLIVSTLGCLIYANQERKKK